MLFHQCQELIAQMNLVSGELQGQVLGTQKHGAFDVAKQVPRMSLDITPPSLNK